MKKNDISNDAAGTSARRNLFIIFIVVYFLFFDTHVQMPVLAPFAQSLGATPFLVGLIVGMYSFFNILGNVLSGHVIDSSSWKKPLIVGMLGTTISLYLYALAATPGFLLIIRAVHGFFGGLVVPATLVLITKTPVTEKTFNLSRRMSFYGAAVGLAALSGPPVAGILSLYYGFATTYTVVASLMLIAVIMTILFVKEENIAAAEKKSLYKHFRKIVRSSLLKASWMLSFALMGSTGTLASFLPLKAASLGASMAVTGGLFAVFACTAIVGQLCWPFFRSYLKLYQSIMFGFIALISALLLVNFSITIGIMAFALFLYGLGFGLIFPSMLELVDKGSVPQWKGLATGFFFVFFSLGAAMVPPVSGLLWQTFAVAPFLTAMWVCLVLVLVVMRGLDKKI